MSENSIAQSEMVSIRQGETWPSWALYDPATVAPQDPSKSVQPLGNSILLEKKLPKFKKGAENELISRARSTRFMLQAAARELLPSHNVAKCLRAKIPGKKTVDVCYSDEKKRAYYSGLLTCHSIHQCPVCAARVAEERKQKLAKGLEQSDYWAFMVTLTIGHKKNQPLAQVLDILLKAQRRFMSGRAIQYLKEEFGIVGSLRGLEITHGENGWHPHSHILFLSTKPPSSNFQRELYVHVTLMWKNAVELAGGYASLYHAVDVSFHGREKLGDYVSKLDNSWDLADEITKAVLKRGRRGGRTPNQLLYDYVVSEDVEAGEIWKEYAQAMKGKKHLSASRGFWQLLNVDFTADSEITNFDEADLIMAQLTPAQWRRIVRNKPGKRFEDYRSDVLREASKGDLSHFEQYLRELLNDDSKKAYHTTCMMGTYNLYDGM